ncbi:MAG: thioester reductase domain-containing protein [Caldilineaceae bacterium]
MTHTTAHHPIAIVGIGCAFPGARGVDEYWQLLSEGREAIREVPPERFDIAPYYDPALGRPGKIVTKRGGFIDGIDQFEPGFFGISPREAENMDPQQRLLLEVTWESIEDAGLTRRELSSSTAAVFIGMSSADYSALQLNAHDSATMDVYTLGGTARSILAGRLSHAFDLKGPSIALDTACSSSLAAVHLACQSIWHGGCDLALAGGVNMILTPEPWAVLSLARIISPDGMAKVFDADANGFVRGEGAGVVVLKPLAKAQADGDSIYAVIRGSAMNNDGRNSSVMTPNQEAQEAVLRAAYRHAGIAPADVQYVEAHGTGTSVGDPIEARALGAVMAEGRMPRTPCLIGSVKTNIGHLEAAAGIAGLIKAALCLQRRAIPPSLHFSTPNPAVPWDTLPLLVQQELSPWPDTDGPALAGVSSFGISGTNVHTVLAEAPPEPLKDSPGGAAEVQLLPLSAHTPEGLADTAARYQTLLAAHEKSAALQDICYTAAVRRNHHPHRAAFVARTGGDMAEQIQAWLLAAGGAQESVVPDDGFDGPVFVFSGQGSRFWPLDVTLFRRFPVLQDALEQCEQQLRIDGANWSLLEQLTASDEASRLHEADVCQVAILSCQIALAALWRSWGIEPSAVIGHSLGEVAAAQVAGAITLEQAIHIAGHRGRITKQASGRGAMVLVGLAQAETEALIRSCSPGLAWAVSNSATNSVVSGDLAALDDLIKKCQVRNIFARRLPAIDYAAHSYQMEPLKHRLADVLAELAPQPPRIPFYSTVTAAPLEGRQLDASYWAANLREPVRFHETMQRALADGHRLFLEVHPTQVLQRPMQETCKDMQVQGGIYPSLQREAEGPAMLLTSLGSMYANGSSVRWEAVYSAGGRNVPLPRNAWQRHRYWLQGPQASSMRHAQSTPGALHPLLGQILQSAAKPDIYIAQTTLAVSQPHYLGDHRVYSAAVFPAAAYIEMALAIVQQMPGQQHYALENFRFEKALILPDSGSVLVQIGASRRRDTVELEYFRCHTPESAAADPAWTRHAQGTVRLLEAEAAPGVQTMAPADFIAEADAQIEHDAHYDMMSAHGLRYGPCFRGIKCLWRRDRQVLAQLALPPEVAQDLSHYQIHPAVLDMAFQSVAACLDVPQAAQRHETLLPVALKSLHIFGQLQHTAYAHAVLGEPLTGATQRQITADVFLLDSAGSILVGARGLVLQRLDREVPGEGKAAEQLLYEIAWRPQLQVPAPPTHVPGTNKPAWLLLGPDTKLREQLADQLEQAGGAGTTYTIGHDQAHLDLARPEQIDRCLAVLAEADRLPAAVVMLAAPEGALNDASTETGQVPVDMAALRGLINLVQSLVRHGGPQPPRLWIVTRGTQPVYEGGQIVLDQAPLWGIVRTAALEYPALRCSAIDLCASPEEDDGRHVAQEVLANGPENLVAYRGGQRTVPRLVTHVPSRAPVMRTALPDEAYRLEIPAPGILDRLTLTAAVRVPPEPDQVEIRVHCAGLNFLDVLSALGLRPDQGSAAPSLGLECAGVITRIGSEVTTVAVGDAVIAVAPHSIGTYVCTPAALVVPKPQGLGFAAAAALPIAYLTAYYALHTLGRIRRGERILIHAAAGGVGLAAVHLAQRAGAEIFVTAGSAEKRAYLQSLGVRHTMDSRSLDFADEIMARTQGEGVDLVLNSLAGEAIPRSLATLRPSGRFLEIGKRDIYEGSRLDMGLLRKNIAFFAIDLIPLLMAQPQVCREMLYELTALLAGGALPPLPYTEYPITEASEAFRHMAQARHIGKIVINTQASAEAGPVTIAAAPSAILRSDATYLVTGGLGALGLQLAAWLVQHGAKHLVLVGRHPATPDASATIAALAAQSADIVVKQADASSAADLYAVLDVIAQTLPPLRGVFHLAGVLDDGLLLHMNEEKVARVLAPKAGGAWLLHCLTRHLDLDHFVMYSSATAVLGSPGQANYTAANAFLDALVHYRRRQGLPALALNWGAWAEVGMAAHSEQAEGMARYGILGLPPQLGLELLQRTLPTSAVQVTALRADWPRLLKSFSQPMLAELAAGVSAGTAPAQHAAHRLHAQLRDLDPAERHGLVVNVIRQQLVQVLRTPAHQIGLQQPLSDLGVDSLTTVELIYRMEAELGVAIPLPVLLQGPTIASLAALALEMLGMSQAHAPASELQGTAPGAHTGERFAVAVTELTHEAELDPGIQFVSGATTSQVNPDHIFLTGATGFLGTYLLHDLLAATQAQVHCLVRATDTESARTRLMRNFARAFPWENLAIERVVVVLGDLAQPQMGLSTAEFDRLAEESDLVLHSGAQVNWLAPYTRLHGANVLGTETIIRLAARRGSLPVHYVSSLAVFPVLEHAQQVTIDERTSLDHGGVLHGGYAQTKWVAEKMVTAAQARGLSAAIYRPSLIVGDSKNGNWYGDNIVATMLRSWIELGMAPDIAGEFDLVPVDYVSRTIVGLLCDCRGSGVYHLNSSQPVTVANLVDWLRSYGFAIHKAPYAAWRAAMLRTDDAGRQLMLNAVGPLLALQVSEDVGWLTHVPRFENCNTVPLLAEGGCPAIDEALVQKLVSCMRQDGLIAASTSHPPELRSISV